MIIKIEKVAKEARVKLPDLITRPVGRKMYEKTRLKIEDAGKDEVVVLDFDNIKVIDSSFIDEFIVRLIGDSVEKEYYLKLTNISNVGEINIDSVFQSHSKYSKRIGIAKENFGGNNRYYLGPLADFENDIIDYLRINKHATLDDISKFSGLSIAESEKTMNELVDLKLIRMYDNKYTNV